MEIITYGGTHENQVQANAFLQFTQEQCLQQYIEEPTRKYNILDFFLTKNDQLTRQIIINETSMCDHNIIQIQTNMKIVEENQNHQIKESNLSYRDLKFFNEDISFASIDADLFNTNWDLLLTDVKTPCYPLYNLELLIQSSAVSIYFYIWKWIKCIRL